MKSERINYRKLDQNYWRSIIMDSLITTMLMAPVVAYVINLSYR